MNLNNSASKFIPILIILLFGCNRLNKQKALELHDTIARLRMNAAFIPLDSTETYDFINRYYLLRLDTMRTGRKLYIHPLIGRNFYQIFLKDKAKLQAIYNNDTVFLKKEIPLPIEQITTDEHYSWNSKRLVRAVTVSDTLIKDQTNKSGMRAVEGVGAWHKKFGYGGYMCISYPQYNPYTHKLFIREWLEDASFCGTGRENEFFFTKIQSGWRADN